MNTPDIAKAGKLLCVDSGEYSDYSVHGFFVVLRDFDPNAELAAHLKANPDQPRDERLSPQCKECKRYTPNVPMIPRFEGGICPVRIPL